MFSLALIKIAATLRSTYLGHPFIITGCSLYARKVVNQGTLKINRYMAMVD